MLYVSNVLIADLNTKTISKDKEELGIASGVIEHPEITNIALFGIDARDPNSFTGLADSIMVLTIDEIHNKIKLTSVMRDTRVFLGTDYYATSTNYDKINHSYSYGGPEMTIRALNANFGFNITDYITVNFHGLAGIIDAFGGVDIVLTAEEIVEVNANVDELVREGAGPTIEDRLPLTEGGLTHMNGYQAVAYSRIRRIDSNGDAQRVLRQQAVLTALATKATAVSPFDYPTIVQGTVGYCETSLDVTKILDMASILTKGFTMETMSVPDDLTTTPITSGTMERDLWMWTYDTFKAGEEINRFIYEDKYDLYATGQPIS